MRDNWSRFLDQMPFLLLNELYDMYSCHILGDLDKTDLRYCLFRFRIFRRVRTNC